MSNFDNPFDDLFDFDGDGKTDLAELIQGIHMIEDWMKDPEDDDFSVYSSDDYDTPDSEDGDDTDYDYGGDLFGSDDGGSDFW